MEFIENKINRTALICICSKSPNYFLYDCIENFYKIQIENDKENYKICVIDSDSDDFTTYNEILKDFPDVEIHYSKNKNYEYGAWKIAYNIYPNYDVYICIQDSMVITNKIDLNFVNNYNALIYFHHSGYNSHSSIKDRGIEILKNTSLDFENIINDYFCLAQHSSFVVNNYYMNDIFKTLLYLPMNKEESCIYERILGIYFINKKINLLNLEWFIIKKLSGGRI